MTSHTGLIHGTVIAAFGRHYEVLPDTGGIDTPAAIQCYPRGKRSEYVCGDRAAILLTAPHQGVIETMQPRHNLIRRSDRWRQKIIAANLTLIVIVVATEPDFSDLLLSRCIAAAESERLAVLIVLNKIDIPDKLAHAREKLAIFDAVGYPVLELSALGDITPLMNRLQGERSLLVGQSGMGKSTLLNSLVPHAARATREISAALNSGKHTTTYSRLYPLAGTSNSWIIDSPGLQAFGLSHLDQPRLEAAFSEFAPFMGKCRFRNCRHNREPGCALREAAATGTLSMVRLEHFSRILAEISESG